jgi:hypothetical protein
MGYGLDDPASILGKIFSPSSQLPDRLWGSPSIQANGYRRLFARGVKWHLQLVPKSRMVELNLHSPIYLHSIVTNLPLTITYIKK